MVDSGLLDVVIGITFVFLVASRCEGMGVPPDGLPAPRARVNRAKGEAARSSCRDISLLNQVPTQAEPVRGSVDV